MSSILRIPGTIVALSPIQHGGDEKTGSTPVLRSLTHCDSAAARHVRLPFFSGNAIRGIMRRLLMRDMCERLGYERERCALDVSLFRPAALRAQQELF